MRRLTPLFSTTLFFAAAALAQVYNQPTEVITSTPISVFSERTGSWPSTEIPQDEFKSDAQPLADQLNSVPGVNARDSGSPTISIRGSVDADRVMKLYDGLPLNMADGVGGSDLFVPQEAIASVELIKMPASVFYGGSAMRGAIDGRTRIFDRSALRLDVADDSATLGTRSVFGALPFQVGNGEARRANYQLTAFDEFAPGRYHYDTTNGLGSGRENDNWHETTRATLTGTSHVAGLMVTPHLMYVRAEGESPGPLTSPTRSSFDSLGTLIALDVKKQFNDELTLDVRLFDLRLDGKYDKGTPIASDSSTARTAISTDLDWNWRHNVQSRFFVDLDLDAFHASYVGGNHYDDTVFDIGQSHEIGLSDTWSLQLGDRYLSSFGENLGTVTIADNLETSRVWITYAEGFRAPSLSDRFSNTSYFIGNPGLKPERSDSIEIGVAHLAGPGQSHVRDGATYGASIYAIQDKNLMDTQPAGGNAETKVNLDHARTYGAEASLGYSYHVWSATLAYNTMDAQSEAQGTTPAEPLRISPKNQASLVLSQQMGPVVLELQDTYWSRYFDRVYPSNQLMALPAWNKVDLGVRTMGFTDIEIKCGVLNLFDQARQLTWGYPEFQRRFYASVLRYF